RRPSRPRLPRARGVLPPCRPRRRRIVAPGARTRDLAHDRPRPGARRGDASRLSGLWGDARGAAPRAVGGGARQAQAEAARKTSRSRRRAHFRTPEATGPPYRARTGHGDRLSAAARRVIEKDQGAPLAPFFSPFVRHWRI